MIDTCDPAIASWTEDGEMFTVKDQDLFASEVSGIVFRVATLVLFWIDRC